MMAPPLEEREVSSSAAAAAEQKMHANTTSNSKDKDNTMMLDDDDNDGGDNEDSKIFPQRLMEILSCEEYHNAIRWLPHGRAFIIRDRALFAEQVMPKYFSRKAKFSSFTRKLNRWSFTRVSNGPEVGAYYHEFFLRDKPHLAAQMFCKNARAKLAMASNHNINNTKSCSGRNTPDPPVANATTAAILADHGSAHNHTRKSPPNSGNTGGALVASHHGFEQLQQRDENRETQQQRRLPATPPPLPSSLLAAIQGRCEDSYDLAAAAAAAAAVNNFYDGMVSHDKLNSLAAYSKLAGSHNGNQYNNNRTMYTPTAFAASANPMQMLEQQLMWMQEQELELIRQKEKAKRLLLEQYMLQDQRERGSLLQTWSGDAGGDTNLAANANRNMLPMLQQQMQQLQLQQQQHQQQEQVLRGAAAAASAGRFGAPGSSVPFVQQQQQQQQLHRHHSGDHDDAVLRMRMAAAASTEPQRALAAPVGGGSPSNASLLLGNRNPQEQARIRQEMEELMEMRLRQKLSRAPTNNRASAA